MNPTKSWLNARETNMTKVKLSTSFHLSNMADIITDPLDTTVNIIRARYRIHRTEKVGSYWIKNVFVKY